MSTTTAGGPTGPATASTDDDAPRSTRDRILDAASDLFYAHGIRAISADKVIERAHITKVTFYRHFRTKDDLVVAYLERRAAWERAAFAEVRAAAGDDGAETLRLFARGFGAASCSPGFRGCPFLNAAAEYADPDSPVRQVVATHRAWFRGVLGEAAAAAGAPDAEAAAEELMMLRDGAAMAAYLDDPARVGAALERAMLAVVRSSSR